MRVSSKSCAARPREEGRHDVGKFRRAVSMKTTVEDGMRYNIAECKRLKTVSKRRGVNKTFERYSVLGKPPHHCSVSYP